MIEGVLREACMLVMIFSGIPLVASAVTGLLISILQVATQIQEQCIVYIGKLIAVTAAAVLLWGWASRELIGFLQQSLAAFVFIGGA